MKCAVICKTMNVIVRVLNCVVRVFENLRDEDLPRKHLPLHEEYKQNISGGNDGDTAGKKTCNQLKLKEITTCLNVDQRTIWNWIILI